MLKKRITPIQNITYIALMSAVNLIFVLLTTILPFLYVLIIFLLPLTSVIVCLYCKKMYFPIYAFATIGLCLIFNLWKITDTIFYVAPSIITGLIFGICIEKKVPAFFLVLLSTIVQAGITYATIPLIDLMVDINTIDYFLGIFKLSEFQYKDFLPPVFIFVISSIQMLLTYMVLKEEVVKVGYEINTSDISEFVLFFIELGLIVLSFVFTFIYGPLTLLFFGFSLYVGIYQCGLLFNHKKALGIIGILSSLIVTIFLYAGLNHLIKKPYAILILLAFFIIISFISLATYLFKNVDKEQKNEE